MFLEISQYSQESTCAMVSFLIETLAQVFSCEFCKIFKNSFFTEHLRTTASGIVRMSLMDLWACDCLSHDLIIAKLEIYRLDRNTIRDLFDYLSCRKQGTKMGSAYSNWSEVFRWILYWNMQLCRWQYSLFMWQKLLAH